MQWRNLVSVALLALGLTVTGSTIATREDNVAKGDPESGSLSLTLSTNEQAYKPDEAIQFTLMLRNVGSNGIWVGNTIGFADVPGAFVMTVTDAQGKALRGDMAYVAGVLGDFRHEDLFDWIRKRRLVLCPECFLGMTGKLQDYRYDLRKPGKYMLQVSYRDIGYKEMQEEGATSKKIEKAKKEAMFPLWSGAIKSPEVWIEVIP